MTETTMDMTREQAEILFSQVHYLDDCIDIGHSGSSAFAQLVDHVDEAEYDDRMPTLPRMTALLRRIATSVAQEIANGAITLDGEDGPSIDGSDISLLLSFAKPTRPVRPARPRAPRRTAPAHAATSAAIHADTPLATTAAASVPKTPAITAAPVAYAPPQPVIRTVTATVIGGIRRMRTEQGEPFLGCEVLTDFRMPLVMRIGRIGRDAEGGLFPPVIEARPLDVARVRRDGAAERFVVYDEADPLPMAA